MEILYLILFAIGLVALMTFLRKWADAFVMIAFAIGCAVGANLYHSFAFPVEVGGIVFAIDSVLYTVFIHLVAVKFLHYSRKESLQFIYSALVAIIISAVFEFVATILSRGYSLHALENFLSYLVSVVASIIGIYLMELFFRFTLKKKVSNYLSLPIGLLIGSIANSTIYYFVMFLINGQLDSNFWPIIIGSYIGKVFTMILCEISYIINSEKLWCPSEVELRKLKNDK